MPGNSPLYTAPKSSSDFWKFWAGQSISTLGSSFTGFALPLLIFKLTGSPLDLSFTVAASVLPYLFFGLVIGAWVDRVNRKRLMILTDLARALVIASSVHVLVSWLALRKLPIEAKAIEVSPA